MAPSKVADNGVYFAGEKINPFATGFVDLSRELRDQVYSDLISLIGLAFTQENKVLAQMSWIRNGKVTLPRPYALTDERTITRGTPLSHYKAPYGIFLVSHAVSDEFKEVLFAYGGGPLVERSFVDSAEKPNAYYAGKLGGQATTLRNTSPHVPYIPIDSFQFISNLQVGFTVTRGRICQRKSHFAALQCDELRIVNFLVDALKDSQHLKCLSLTGRVKLPVDVFWVVKRLSPLAKLPAFCLAEMNIQGGILPQILFKTPQFSWVLAEKIFPPFHSEKYKFSNTRKGTNPDDISNEHTFKDPSDRESVAKWCQRLQCCLLSVPKVKNGFVVEGFDDNKAKHVGEITPE